MTGAMTLAALIGLASLLAGMALGWYLRRTNAWCAQCGGDLSCDCGVAIALPGPQVTEAGRR